MAINSVAISGNITRDPELRASTSGTSVLQLSVAVNERRKNQKTGEWEDSPNYIDCVMFGNRADSVSRILSKGTKVAISGKLRWRSWDKDGERRSKVEVVIDEIEILSSGKAEAVKAEVIEPQGSINFGGKQVPLYEDDVPF